VNFDDQFSWARLEKPHIEQKSIRALRNHVRHARNDSAFYRRVLHDFDPESITGFAQFEQVPLTSAQQLVQFSDQLLTVSPESISCWAPQPWQNIHLTGYTTQDLDRLYYSVALCLHRLEAAGKTVIVLASELDPFTILTLHHAFTLLDIRFHLVHPEAFTRNFEQLLTMQARMVVGNCQTLNKVAQLCQKHGFDPRRLHLDSLLSIEHPHAYEPNKQQRASLARIWGVPLYPLSPISELGIAVSCCPHSEQLHLAPELCYVELVDPHGNPVGDQQRGEVVITPFGVEATPILRLKTGIFAAWNTNPCNCGTHAPRLHQLSNNPEDARQMTEQDFKQSFPHGLIALLKSIDWLEDFLISIEGNPQFEQAEIHAVVRPNQVIQVSEQIRTIFGKSWPILVTNSVTLKAMRPADQPHAHWISSTS